MEVNVVVSMDDKEVRDAIMSAAKLKLGNNDGRGSCTIILCGDGAYIGNLLADVKFQYKKT